jgi:hypothetical protein
MKPRSIINLLLAAEGTKLSVTYAAGGNTVKIEHAGNKVYRNGTLNMILTEEGYITRSAGCSARGCKRPTSPTGTTARSWTVN